MRGRNSAPGRCCHSTGRLRTFQVSELALSSLLLQTAIELLDRMPSKLESSSASGSEGHCLQISTCVPVPVHLRRCYTWVSGCLAITVTASVGDRALGLSSYFLQSNSWEDFNLCGPSMAGPRGRSAGGSRVCQGGRSGRSLDTRREPLYPT